MMMQLMDFILTIDQHLAIFLQDYGMWIYGILFLIIFVETGLVVMPFLPGDSLLFAAGALAAVTGAINPILLIILLSLAAVLGDTLNYHIGKYIGPKVFVTNSRWINHQHLVNTQKFLQRMAKDDYSCTLYPVCSYLCTICGRCGQYALSLFLSYNIIGGCLWIMSFVLLGYFLGISLPLKIILLM